MASMTRRGFIGLGAAGATVLAAGRALPSLFGGGSTDATFVDVASTSTGAGLWVLDSSGRILALGDAQSLVSIPPEKVPQAVAVAANSAGTGLWVLTASGDVTGFGTAQGLSADPAAIPRFGTFIDFAPTPSGGGAWLLSASGGILAVGDAQSLVSIPPEKVPQAVAIAANPAGTGLWVLEKSGGPQQLGAAPRLVTGR